VSSQWAAEYGPRGRGKDFAWNREQSGGAVAAAVHLWSFPFVQCYQDAVFPVRGYVSCSPDLDEDYHFTNLQNKTRHSPDAIITCEITRIYSCTEQLNTHLNTMCQTGQTKDVLKSSVDSILWRLESKALCWSGEGPYFTVTVLSYLFRYNCKYV